MKKGMRQEILSWSDVDHLIDVLLPQFHGHFDGMVMITRGGIVPGGMIAEALGIRHIFTAAVKDPATPRSPGVPPNCAGRTRASPDGVPKWV